MTELMSTLDMSYELSNNLFQIYEYVYRLLILANISNDTEKLNEAINRITEIRDAWEEAIKIGEKLHTTTPAMEHSMDIDTNFKKLKSCSHYKKYPIALMKRRRTPMVLKRLLQTGRLL